MERHRSRRSQSQGVEAVAAWPGWHWRGPHLHRTEGRQQAHRGLPRTVEALKRHRKGQLEVKLKAGGAYQDGALVFATSLGTPWNPQTVTQRSFKPLLRRAGLPEIRFHDLRHTFATLLLARGVHPTYVQRALGHASVKMTLDRYSHWMASMGRATAEAIEAVLS